LETLSKIVAGATKVTLLGGGEVRESDLRAVLDLAPTLVCVDGGGNLAGDLGLKPAAIAGDFDSFDTPKAGFADVPRILMEDQNYGDFDKTLAALPTVLTLAVGFLGARLDHQMAAITALSRAPGPVVLVGARDVACIVPYRIEMVLTPGTRVSVWPLVPSRGRSTGLAWPIDGLTLDPQGRIGTSNVAEGGPVMIEVADGELLLILPRQCLETLIDALVQ